jgi:hypothetical protein
LAAAFCCNPAKCKQSIDIYLQQQQLSTLSPTALTLQNFAISYPFKKKS